jgi:hypothetical protein
LHLRWRRLRGVDSAMERRSDGDDASSPDLPNECQRFRSEQSTRGVNWWFICSVGRSGAKNSVIMLA